MKHPVAHDIQPERIAEMLSGMEDSARQLRLGLSGIRLGLPVEGIARHGLVVPGLRDGTRTRPRRLHALPAGRVKVYSNSDYFSATRFSGVILEYTPRRILR